VRVHDQLQGRPKAEKGRAGFQLQRMGPAVTGDHLQGAGGHGAVGRVEPADAVQELHVRERIPGQGGLVTGEAPDQTVRGQQRPTLLMKPAGHQCPLIRQQPDEGRQPVLFLDRELIEEPGALSRLNPFAEQLADAFGLGVAVFRSRDHGSQPSYSAT